MLPLLSCDSDTTACLKASRKVQVCRGKKRKTWWYQIYSGDSKDQLRIMHAHKWLLARSTNSSHWRETTTYNLRYCRLKLFVYGWLIPMLTSWVLKKRTNHSTNLSQQSVYQERNKYEKNNSKTVFLSARATCLHLACHVHTLITQCTIYRLPVFVHFVQDLCKHAASKGLFIWARLTRLARFPRSRDRLTSRSFVKVSICSYERAGWLGSQDLGFSNRDLGKRARNCAIWTLHPGYRDEWRDEFWRSGSHRLELPAVFNFSTS